jgi:hypothetical protein
MVVNWPTYQPRNVFRNSRRRGTMRSAAISLSLVSIRAPHRRLFRANLTGDYAPQFLPSRDGIQLIGC